MREALTLALQETEAGMILVSHDRHLLRTTADELFLVADGAVKPFDGDLDDYAAWLGKQRAAPPPTKRKPTSGAASDGSAADRQALQEQRRPLLKENEKLEKQLAGWQTEKALLDTRLADPALYASSDKTLLEGLLKRQKELAGQIERAETRWLEIHDALETLAVSA
jgi:ATP-binding cassette, subfamily F, member 3